MDPIKTEMSQTEVDVHLETIMAMIQRNLGTIQDYQYLSNYAVRYTIFLTNLRNLMDQGLEFVQKNATSRETQTALQQYRNQLRDEFISLTQWIAQVPTTPGTADYGSNHGCSGC
jgi:phage terminase small subunit